MDKKMDKITILDMMRYGSIKKANENKSSDDV